MRSVPQYSQDLQVQARFTGALYLVIIVCGMFSEVMVRARLIVSGDAAATADHILSAEGLFRVAFASDLVVFLCDVAVAVLLYALLKSVDVIWAQISTGFRLVGTAIYGLNLLNYFAALLILKNASSLAVFDNGQVQALALLFLDIHKHGYDLGLVFFGLHCLVLGFLLFKSGTFPRILGVLVILAGAGYLIGSFTLFLFPEFTRVVAPVYLAPLIGELALCFWLLIRGVRNGP